jgi:hypothetical protein
VHLILYKKQMSRAECKFGKDCTRAACLYVHPSGRTLYGLDLATEKKSTICKFGITCPKRSYCKFVHPKEKLQTPLVRARPGVVPTTLTQPGIVLPSPVSKSMLRIPVVLETPDHQIVQPATETF